MVFYAPTINSYKRYVDASWAPTRLAWSYDNRTAGFRVVGTDRACESSAGFLARTAIPISPLPRRWHPASTGIRNRIEPPACFTGDVYAARHLPHVPHTLRDATDLFEASGFAKRAFGEDVVEHYAHFFRTEEAAYRRGGHRLGTPTILRTDLMYGEAARGQSGPYHGRGQRYRQGIGGCSSQEKGPPSWSWIATRSADARRSTRSEAPAGTRCTCMPMCLAPATAHGWSPRQNRSSATCTCCSTTPASCTAATTMRCRPMRRFGTSR